MMDIVSPSPTTLALFRWNNPDTTCEYPFLAVSEDRGLLLSLGNYRLCFEWSVPSDVEEWLELDYVPLEQTMVCDLSTVRHLIDTLFAGGAEFCMVSFNGELRPVRIGFSLNEQDEADDGPDFDLDAGGKHQRVHRTNGTRRPVNPGERALLEVCEAMLRTLVADYRPLLIEPAPPRYRRHSTPFSAGKGYLS